MNNISKNKLELVKAMHSIVLTMNNEEAYMLWIYDMPDEPSEDDFEYFALPENESSFNDLVQKFTNLMKRYLKDGLYINKTLYTPTI